MSTTIVLAILSLIVSSTVAIVSIARFFYDIGKDIAKKDENKKK